VMARLKQQNPGIPDMRLLNAAAKVQQILNPADKMLLQYMMGQQRLDLQRQKQNDISPAQEMAHEDRMAAIAAAGGRQQDAGWTTFTDNKTGDTYRLNQRTGETQKVVLPEGVSLSKPGTGQGAVNFTSEQQALLSALTENGVSLPANARNKAQLPATLQGLLDRNKGKTPDEIVDLVKAGQIEFGAEKKETQTAATQAGRVQVAANELKEFLPLVLEASAKVPRGSFMPINRLLQTADAQISDPNLKELKIYINSLLNAYDQLAARGGTDVNKRAEARALLISADSHDVLKRALGAFQKEGDAALKAATTATRAPGRAGTQTQAHPQDDEAIQWARQNPNDPRAAAILKANGLQ